MHPGALTLHVLAAGSWIGSDRGEDDFYRFCSFGVLLPEGREGQRTKNKEHLLNRFGRLRLEHVRKSNQ
jgi:hypothetical protein